MSRQTLVAANVQFKARTGASATPANLCSTVPVLAKFCHSGYNTPMTTMNISLPDSLKSFVDEQVSGRGYGTSSEYVRDLIRKDQERQRLRRLLEDGASSSPAAPADKAYFEGQRRRVRRRATK
jgi:antitoxin ParD1/3/4